MCVSAGIYSFYLQTLTPGPACELSQETPTILAFYHPKPSYPVHILIAPRAPVDNLMNLPLDNAALPDQRGKGVYRSLVAARLADARADGMQAAILQADRTSSAPICQKLGFEEICGMELYGWMAEEEHLPVVILPTQEHRQFRINELCQDPG